jgi:glycosyltransferase involved in cell wall biosynthesis
MLFEGDWERGSANPWTQIGPARRRWPQKRDRDVQEFKLRRVALVTDAWHPQTNGVVLTLDRLVRHLEQQGVEVLPIVPDGHRTLPLPSYPEIRVAMDPWKAMDRLKAFAPDAIHLATEGPLGFSTCAWLRRHRLRFTTSFHTRYPEYVSARFPVPVEWGYHLERWFHSAADHTFVSARGLLSELQQRRVGKKLVYWPRGVDLELFNPKRRNPSLFGVPGPVWLYVGRVAVEKSIDDFLKLPLPGTKVVVGDGPSREALQQRFPEVLWRGWRRGQDLAEHFASADCFVFPSKTDTFGMVVLEALASGVPVASYPAPGPQDLVSEGVTGSINENLEQACIRALRCSRTAARDSVENHSLWASHECFRSHLVSVYPGARAARAAGPARMPVEAALGL